ncbi:MAG: C40 family peptidase [Burkholderiales bacterium]
MKKVLSFVAYALIRAMVTSALILNSISVNAAPDELSDPVKGLLKERGLLSSEDTLAAQPDDAVSKLKKIPQAASELVISAMNFLGVPYQLGGADFRNGFDCSGFTHYVYKNSLGLILPRKVDEQANAPSLKSVERPDIKPGDLLFFNTLGRTFSHVGIYVGDGKFIHAPRTGSHVRIENIRSHYWSRHFTGARRPLAGSSYETLAELASEPPSEPNAKGNFVPHIIPAYTPPDYLRDLHAH